MPFVRITLTREAFSRQQKQDMVHRVADAMAAVEGEPMRQGIGIAIEESVNPDEWFNCMPFIAITLIKDALTLAQKQEMLHKVTDSVVGAIGENYRLSTWIVIDESVNDGEWFVGGNKLTIAAIQQIKSGENPWK
jgi:phenylpyruvate tautomerase PptA (4-oxalocrotonate tautomerase family)